jgi:hypothetical protein
VSLGTSKRDKSSSLAILGVPFQLERIGTDGDLGRFAAMFRDLDGQVEAFGVGGADIWVVIGDRKYEFRQIRQLISGARTTPVVDGSGLKHTLEREAVRVLDRDGLFPLAGKKALLVSAVDRFGMAQALVESGADVVFGDFMYNLGIDYPVRNYDKVRTLGKLLLPVITKLPFKWFYPTGEKQEKRTPKFTKYFDEADLICGDWHLIRRFAPDRLSGKTILTQTLRKADLQWLASAGASAAITTTPVVAGETFATNVMEAAIVALLQKRPHEIHAEDYLEVLGRLQWKPQRIDLV